MKMLQRLNVEMCVCFNLPLCVFLGWINVGQSPPTKHSDAVSLCRYDCQLLFHILVTVFSSVLTFQSDIFKKAKTTELILQKLALMILFVLLAILL